jgi:DNA-3-methyladenine glycosylase
MILPPDFYARPTLDVARDLIGQVLVHRTPAGVTSGLIIEVEAYIGEDDPACHAAAGPTKRNAPLYGVPGLAYVYVSYGLHHLANAVTERKGFPAAVLIRALEPLEGLALMRQRRNGAPWRKGKATVADRDLCRGPGNLTAALGIDTGANARPLYRRPLVIQEGPGRTRPLVWGPRVGITKGTDRPWRCHLQGHPGVSATPTPLPVEPADYARRV